MNHNNYCAQICDAVIWKHGRKKGIHYNDFELKIKQEQVLMRIKYLGAVFPRWIVFVSVEKR